MSVIPGRPTPRRRNPPPKAKREDDEAGALSVWLFLLAPLTDPKNVDEWFEIRRYRTSGAARSAAYDIRTGRNSAVPPGAWDATARDGTLFVRYLGNSQEKGNNK